MSGCSYVTPLPGPSPTEKPISVSFVSATRDEAGKWAQWSHSTEVPFRPGRSAYGYVVEMPSPNEVIVTETLTFPKAATVWPSDMAVSDNGRVGTVSRRQIPKNNKVSNAWIISEGDPTGDYELTVSISNEIHHFRFRVIPETPTTEREVDIARLVMSGVIAGVEDDKRPVARSKMTGLGGYRVGIQIAQRR